MKNKEITFRELLKKPYWNSTDIAKATGHSKPTATKTLKAAQAACIAAGYRLLSDYTVYNKYVLQVTGLDIDYMERTGILDNVISTEK